MYVQSPWPDPFSDLSNQACESLARQIFPPTDINEPTTFVLRSRVHDSVGKVSWAIVHWSAYAQTIGKSSGRPVHVQIEFETEKQRLERVKKARKALKHKTRRGFFSRLFRKSKAAAQNPHTAPYTATWDTFRSPGWEQPWP